MQVVILSITRTQSAMNYRSKRATIASQRHIMSAFSDGAECAPTQRTNARWKNKSLSHFWGDAAADRGLT